MADLRNDKNFKTLAEVDDKGNINLGKFSNDFFLYDFFLVYENDEPVVGTLRISIVNASKYWLWIYDIYIEQNKN